MKRFFVTSLILFLSSTLCFTLSPKWFTDLEKVFPSEKFIRAIGEGSSITLAKSFAQFVEETVAWCSKPKIFIFWFFYKSLPTLFCDDLELQREDVSQELK